jgi:DNA polymerase-3 subunit gamma/tau
MLLIRLAFASHLPTPAEALEMLSASRAGSDQNQTTGGSDDAGGVIAATPHRAPVALPAEDDRSGRPILPPLARSSMPAAIAAAEAGVAPSLVKPESAAPRSFVEVVEMARSCNEALLYGHLMTAVHLVRFEPGRIELRLAENVPSDLPQRLSRMLTEATASRWMVSVSREAGEPTLQEQQQAAKAAHLDEVATHPLVRCVLEAFPGAAIERIRGGDASTMAGADGDGEA